MSSDEGDVSDNYDVSKKDDSPRKSLKTGHYKSSPTTSNNSNSANTNNDVSFTPTAYTDGIEPHTNQEDTRTRMITYMRGYAQDIPVHIPDNVDPNNQNSNNQNSNNLGSVLSTETNNAANTTLETLVENLVENFYSRYTEGYLSRMVNDIEVSLADANTFIENDFKVFIDSTNYIGYDPQVINLMNDYLLKSLKRKITRIIKRRNIINKLKELRNKKIPFKDILVSFNSETILFSIAETKPDYEKIKTDLGSNAYTNDYVPPKLKDSIQQHKPKETLKYLSDKYTAGSGIDGSHDAETVKILHLLYELNASNKDLQQIINEMTCMQSDSFNPKKATNDLEKLIADVESKFRHLLIPFIEETTEYVPLELYNENPKVISLLTRPDINTVQESGRSFGKSLFEINTACFDAGTRKIPKNQWIPYKVYKIENVYGVNYMFIADTVYKTNHVFACIDSPYSDNVYWNYYSIEGAVSLNDVLDIFDMNRVKVFEHARRGDCTEDKGYSGQASDICDQYNTHRSAVLEKRESDELWNHFTNGSVVDSEKLHEFLLKLFSDSTKINLFEHNLDLAILLFFSLKGVGDASVESFYQEEVIKGTVGTLLKKGVVTEPESNQVLRMNQIVPTSTLNTVDSFLERLIRLAYLCGKIDYSPPRIRPVAGGGIVTSGGDTIMSDEQIKIIENKHNLLMYVFTGQSREERKKYLMEQFGLDKLERFINSAATTSDPKMKTIILPVLQELYDDRMKKLNNWLNDVVGNSTYDTVNEEYKVNLDNLLSLSGDIGSILNEYDEYTNDILKIPNDSEDNVIFEEKVNEDVEKGGVCESLSPFKAAAYGTQTRHYIKVIVNKDEDSFMLELPSNDYNERICQLIENYKLQTNSEAYEPDEVLGLVKFKGKNYLKFKSSIELFINMYKRFKDVQVKDLCSSGPCSIVALNFFTNIIVERLQKYSIKDSAVLKPLVNDALEGRSGGGKNMTRKKRLTKKRLKRKRITNKKNKKPRSMKFTKKKNKKSKKHKTYKKI